ncbi:hypothetical protein PoB_001041100 [Plakobranchus ocellatus]|uniref:Uncharacterized protein n=1 Tax=Plakobranchus ocellatus TaxID=259542 RepID=A0AAV3YNC7_9GAST|nr:hypothetical protein PoB_001041100 [Plakobranchus ocellatus]
MERYLLAANFTATALETSRGVLSLTWPGPNGPKRYEYNLPEMGIEIEFLQSFWFDVSHDDVVYNVNALCVQGLRHILSHLQLTCRKLLLKARAHQEQELSEKTRW